MSLIYAFPISSSSDPSFSCNLRKMYLVQSPKLPFTVQIFLQFLIHHLNALLLIIHE